MPYVIAVDDETEVLATLGRALEHQGMEVELISNSSEALPTIEDRKPDLVILDIIMPGIDGITICRRLRDDANFIALPILFLTAKGRTDDIVEGLDAGADDYIVKPFHLSELRARVAALLRRGTSDVSANATIEVNDLLLDSKTHQVYADDVCIQLTATEHRLMRYLMSNPDKPMSPMHLLEEVWEYPPNTGDPDLVRAHIRNLRAKLRKGAGEKYIETVHGVGYMIES